MVKKDYYFTGSGKQFNKLTESLKHQFLRYTKVFQAEDCYGENGTLRLRFNISPDMVQEVEELIMEIAKKSGVKVE